MIELVLVFLLGMLVAGLVWLILLPAFWRRAVRLTRKRVESGLPLSVNEIFAEQDRLRAEHGVARARMHQDLDRAQRGLVAAKAELGERLKAETGFLEALAVERRRIAALDAEIGGLRVEIQTRDLRIGELTGARDQAQAAIAGLESQRDTLTARLNQTIDLAESRRLALDEARVLGERAREAHALETQLGAQLRAELQTRQGELREAERRLSTLENNSILAKIRGGEETYQSAVEPQRQAG